MSQLKLVFLLTFLAIFSSNVFADDAKTALATEYLILSKTKESVDSTIEAYVNQIASQNPSTDKDDLRAFFTQYMGWEILKEPTIKIVANLLSTAELSEINQFYKTTSGKALADNSPKMAAEISNLIGTNLNKAMSKMQSQ